MSLEKLLKEKKAGILERWFDAVLVTYPIDTQSFLKKKKNRFANPVAHEISRGMEEIFEQFLSGEKPDEFSPFLDRIIRIRAVQDVNPSTALAFIFDLKTLIREELVDHMEEGHLRRPLERLERTIEELGLLSLDIYVKCRDKIYELRVNEVKNRVGRLLERANMICGVPQKEGDAEVGSMDNLT